jgi:diguanylate cyclase (GGDEF)-like protein
MITSKVKFPIGNDVVSQIVMNVRPEILTEINPAAELDLIPYYTENSGITSFIGVPVFYDDTVMGVLCADTTVTDAYDIRTVGFFGHFTKLIAALVESYIEKYDLSQADRTLSAITNFRRILANKELTINEINESIIESASELIEYSTIGSCCFDDATGDWRITAFKQKHDSDYSLLNKVVQLDSTLIGEAILSARTLYIAPFNDNLARVHPDEENITGGFFAAVPLKSLSNVYGAIFIESKLPLSITSNDLATLEALAENAGSSVEQVMMNHFMQTSSMIDIKTGILTPNALFQRIDEELSRSIDFNGNICLCTFRIDKYASFDPKAFTERMERATVHVIGIIKKHLRYYDIFGKVDENTFGIVLIGMDVQAAKLWAERLRSEIAISILEIMSQRFTLTISMGIASSLGVDSIEVLMNNTRKSLEISVKKGNTVTVF